MREETNKEYEFKDYGEQLRFKYCPICQIDSDNPDFSLNCKSKTYYCHRTGTGGKVKDLRYIDRDFYNFVIKILNETQKPLKINKKSDDNREIKQNFDKIVTSRGAKPLNAEWREYLSNRKIGEKHLDKLFRMGKNNMMMIPITDGKHVVAIKYRGINKELSCESGSQSDYFINWQHIKSRDYLIIVEGEIDLLSGLEAGYDNIVSLPFGATNVKAVTNQKQWIDEFSKIIIAVDNDEAGKKSREKIINELKDIKEKLYSVDMGKYKDFNEVLTGEGKEKIKELVDNATVVEISEEEIFTTGKDGYYMKIKGELVPITDFTLNITGYSNNYIMGTAHTLGRDKEFKAKKTDLLLSSGIVQHIGYYFGAPSTIPSFWSWILKQNLTKYIDEIEHYGIINNKYYDTTSQVICDRNDLVIQNIDSFQPLTKTEKLWLNKNLLKMRSDAIQSLVGICWALGRLHNHLAYPILELAGSTSVGKTEYAEFIVRILFGTKENIKSLGTVSAHQIRSFSSCSNITPWVLDEVKVIGHILRDKAVELVGTIRALYDNKTVNQGNTKDKLYEFKLCTPFIISGETKLNDVSFRNRTITAELKSANKGEYKVYEMLKNSDILEKMGKTALNRRLEKGSIEVERKRLQTLFPDVKDDRQLHNIKCLYSGFLALKEIVKISKDIEKQFVQYLNEIGKDSENVVQNFYELLEMVSESDKDLRSFYAIKEGKHYLWLSQLYKVIAEEHFKTNSTLELLDLRSLRKQLIEENFILNTNVSIRFYDPFTRKTKVEKAVEIVPITIFNIEKYDLL